MDKKIYIVTEGEYSDYQICAVFSTRKKAKEYVNQHGSCCRIEKYDTDKEVKKKTQLWMIVFCIEDEKYCDASITNYDKDIVRDTCGLCFPYREQNYIHFYIDADSMDRAVKIARERFASVKANEYIWLRLTRPYETDRYGKGKYESFNVKTNEFIK